MLQATAKNVNQVRKNIFSLCSKIALNCVMLEIHKSPIQLLKHHHGRRTKNSGEKMKNYVLSNNSWKIHLNIFPFCFYLSPFIYKTKL